MYRFLESCKEVQSKSIKSYPNCVKQSLKNPKTIQICHEAEMSFGLDLDWTGSGIRGILLILGWIRSAKCFINLGSAPYLDLVHGKKLV